MIIEWTDRLTAETSNIVLNEGDFKILAGKTGNTIEGLKQRFINGETIRTDFHSYTKRIKNKTLTNSLTKIIN